MTPAFRNTLALLLVTALVIRLAAGWLWQSRLEGQFGMGDSDSYWTLALTIAEGKPYEYGSDRARVFRAPAIQSSWRRSCDSLATGVTRCCWRGPKRPYWASWR